MTAITLGLSRRQRVAPLLLALSIALFGSVALASEGSGDVASDEQASDVEWTATTEGGDRLVGKWNVEMATMLDDELAALPEEQREAARAMYADASMSMEFAQDGTMVVSISMMGQQESQSGQWTVLSPGQDALEIATRQGPDADTDVVGIAFVGDDELTMTIDGSELTFHRETQEPGAE